MNFVPFDTFKDSQTFEDAVLQYARQRLMTIETHSSQDDIDSDDVGNLLIMTAQANFTVLQNSLDIGGECFVTKTTSQTVLIERGPGVSFVANDTDIQISTTWQLYRIIRIDTNTYLVSQVNVLTEAGVMRVEHHNANDNIDPDDINTLLIMDSGFDFTVNQNSLPLGGNCYVTKSGSFTVNILKGAGVTFVANDLDKLIAHTWQTWEIMRVDTATYLVTEINKQTGDPTVRFRVADAVDANESVSFGQANSLYAQQSFGIWTPVYNGSTSGTVIGDDQRWFRVGDICLLKSDDIQNLSTLSGDITIAASGLPFDPLGGSNSVIRHGGNITYPAGYTTLQATYNLANDPDIRLVFVGTNGTILSTGADFSGSSIFEYVLIFEIDTA